MVTDTDKRVADAIIREALDNRTDDQIGADATENMRQLAHSLNDDPLIIQRTDLTEYLGGFLRAIGLDKDNASLIADSMTNGITDSVDNPEAAEGIGYTIGAHVDLYVHADYDDPIASEPQAAPSTLNGIDPF